MNQNRPATSLSMAARRLASEAFLFGLPLVLVSIQADFFAQVTEPKGLKAPYGQFGHAREFVNASNRAVVGFNLDNLYSFAMLDLSVEPMVLSIPDMGDRYWIMQVIDGWNGVPAAPGSRTHGGRAGPFLIGGPGWTGDIPAGVEQIRSPTSIAMIGGRTYCSGPEDYSAVHALQDGYRLTPLSRWGQDYTPPVHVPLRTGIDGDTLVNDQVMALTAEQFYRKLNRLLVKNPAYPEDTETLERLAELGIAAGADFDMSGFSEEVTEAIALGYQDGRKAMLAATQELGEEVNGWSLAYDMGRYGTRYAYRAAWTLVGVGGNLLEDAFYPTTTIDSEGHDLTGANRYELKFANDEIPPADAFWSITMYDAESYLVPNEIDRYMLGDRSDLIYGSDGSLTIFLRKDPPATEHMPNWLPAPEGRFRLALRLYVPKQQVIDRIWHPPPVNKVSQQSA